ncbi:MAG: hypothetical protein ACRCZB_02875 [Bacteroidales bacterium]
MKRRGNELTPEQGYILTNTEREIYSELVLLSKDDTEARWVEVTIAQMNEELRIAEEKRKE